MGRANNNPGKWPVRMCLYCGQDFYKAPTYATCGHPRCIKQHREAMAKTRDRSRDHSLARRLPKWKAPDPYAPDTKGREKIYKMLLALDASNADNKTLPYLVQAVAIRTKSRPAEVIEVWNSMKEKVSA